MVGLLSMMNIKYGCIVYEDYVINFSNIFNVYHSFEFFASASRCICSSSTLGARLYASGARAASLLGPKVTAILYQINL